MLGHTTMADILRKQGDAKGGLEHLAQAPMIVPFELKTVEGEPKSYWDLKCKVTLVNLFFPT